MSNPNPMGELDYILANIITRETHRGSVNRVRVGAKEAITNLVDSEINRVIDEVLSELPKEEGTYSHHLDIWEEGWNRYRDQIIPLIQAKRRK